jgi:hypothetical protein
MYAQKARATPLQIPKRSTSNTLSVAHLEAGRCSLDQGPVISGAAGRAMRRRASSVVDIPERTKLKELWERESSLKMRGLPRASPRAPEHEVSSEVGMVRLVYKKARDLRKRRNSSVPSLHQVGTDIQHSIRICSKAKHFVDVAMEGVIKKTEGIDNVKASRVEVDDTTCMGSATAPDSPRKTPEAACTTPISTAANKNWLDFLDLLEAASPKTARSIASGHSRSPKKSQKTWCATLCP